MAEQKEKGMIKEERVVEDIFHRYLGNSILLFLSLLSILILVAAVIAAFETVVREFPKLWQITNE